MSDVALNNVGNLHDCLVAGLESGVFAPLKEDLDHHFAEGLYGRRCRVGAGSVFTTKVHKKEHISVCLAGKIVIVDEAGERVEITAPHVFTTPAGTHRAIYVLEDVDWLTVHAYDAEPDLDIIVQTLTCDNREQYNNLLGVG